MNKNWYGYANYYEFPKKLKVNPEDVYCIFFYITFFS